MKLRHARGLIEQHRFVLDVREAWSEHREGTTGRYKFPYGDFEKVHRCGVLSAGSRAGQYKYFDVENAFAHCTGCSRRCAAAAG